MTNWHFIAPANETVEKSLGIVRCSQCGRPLTDHDSVARGIGPVCLRKHKGPGKHPSGSPQSVHADGSRKARGEKKVKLYGFIPKAHQENVREVSNLDVKGRLREYFENRAMAKGQRGKRIAVRSRLLGYTPDNDGIYSNKSGGETVFRVRGAAKSKLYFPTKL